MKKVKIFLGGTCNESTWRDELIKLLNSNIDYFNPVVEDWNPSCQEIEEQEKANSDFNLYVITPKMTGVFSIAEMVDDSNKKPEKTICVYLSEDGDKEFDKGQIRSLNATFNLIRKNGALALCDYYIEDLAFGLNELGKYLNNEIIMSKCFKKKEKFFNA